MREDLQLIQPTETLREELSEIIGFESRDPRLLAVEVTEVHVSSDGRHANVRVVVPGDDKAQRESLAALDHAIGYFRHELASRLRLRHVPDLHFERDKNPDVESRIAFLVKRAEKSRGHTEK